MKTTMRFVIFAAVVCLALLSVSCTSDDYGGTSTVYVGVGYGGYGPGWGGGWGGYYRPPPVVIGPPRPMPY